MCQDQPHVSQTVSQAGEEAVLAAIREVIDPHNATRTGLELGLGDDAAVVRFGHGQVAMTTDTMAEGQDFRRRWWAQARDWATDVGTKAAAQNLSDINAMGATTTALLISLTLPPDTPLEWVQDFYRGVIRACQAPGAQDCLIAGGDLASGETISVTITALGEAPDGGSPLTRAGANAGDVLAVCGPLGYAAAGLALLEGGHAQQEGGSHRQLIHQCLLAQQRPTPPLTAGAAARSAGASAGMDLSDGLLRDATRLAEASAVSIRLDDAALAAEAEQLTAVAAALGASPADALEWVLTGGEDYSLLATFSADAKLPTGFRAIGTVVDDTALDDDTVQTDKPRNRSHAVLTDHTVSGAGWDSVAPIH
nr:thiamine-phosphate kinase [Garicola koreensis]